MERLSFFDCNVVVGRRTVPRPENNLTLEQILEELQYAGIDEALVYHADAREYDPRVGNEQVTEICQAHPQLSPAYVLLPHHTGEMPGGDALIEYLHRGGARAVRLFPRDHNYGLGPSWCGPLFSTLAAAEVPVLLDLDQTSWPEVDEILSAHPRLHLIVLRVGYRIDRWVYPLFEKHPGLHLETSFYELHLAIETVTERFGAERLIFGSGLPVWDAGGAITPILYADISAEAKRQIAGETLRRMLWSKKQEGQHE